MFFHRFEVFFIGLFFFWFEKALIRDLWHVILFFLFYFAMVHWSDNLEERRSLLPSALLEILFLYLQVALICRPLYFTTVQKLLLL